MIETYYKLSTDGFFTKLTAAQFRTHNDVQTTLYGDGYVLLLNFGGKPVYAAIDTALVRKTIARNVTSDFYDAIRLAIENGFRVGTPKRYRVFYNEGVYQWYINTGRAPLHQYRRYGTLAGAYNVRAGVWAKFI